MRNRHTIIHAGVIFCLVASTLSALAQSRNATQLAQLPVGGSNTILFDGGSRPTASLAETTPLLASDDGANLPDAPSASPEPSPAPAPSPRRDAIQGAPPAASGSLMGGYDREVADRRYWAVTGSMFAVSVANAELAQRCLHEHTCSWVPDSLRSRKAMYGIGIPADLAVSYFTYRLKRKHSQFWFVPAALVTGLNGFVAIHDFRRLK